MKNVNGLSAIGKGLRVFLGLVISPFNIIQIRQSILPGRKRSIKDCFEPFSRAFFK